MAYMTAAKIAAIKKAYPHTLPKTALALLLTEMAALEASIVAGGGIDWGEVGDIASIGVKAAGTSTEFARADHVHDIPANGVSTAKIADGAVTGKKIALGALYSQHFSGLAAAGPITLTYGAVGDQVIAITNLSDNVDGAGSFEGQLTVELQLQQTDAADLSTKKYVALMLARS